MSIVETDHCESCGADKRSGEKPSYCIGGPIGVHIVIWNGNDRPIRIHLLASNKDGEISSDLLNRLLRVMCMRPKEAAQHIEEIVEFLE